MSTIAYYFNKKQTLSELSNSLKVLLSKNKIEPFVYCNGRNFYYIGEKIIITTKYYNVNYSNIVSFPIGSEDFESKYEENKNIARIQRYTEEYCKTSFILHKSKLIHSIKSNYNSTAKQMKILCTIKSEEESKTVHFDFKTRKKSSSVFPYELTISKFPIVRRRLEIHDNLLTVDCFLLYQALEIFQDNIRLEISDNNEFIRFHSFQNGVNTKVIILTEN